MKDSARYDIAISFAGEDRPTAKALAAGLTLLGFSVFYDEYEKADLWGKDLYVHLTKVYRDDSKFCLLLISEHYAKKQWPNHERRTAQARAFNENREYILPLRLDDTPIDGVLDTVGYVDARKNPIKTIIELLGQKIRKYNVDHGITYNIVRAEEVFQKAPLHGPGGAQLKDANCSTECPTCRTKQRLSEASLSLDEDTTVYSCRNGCQAIAVISRPGLTPWPGRGYRLGEYVIRNARDLIITMEGMRVPVVIPASPAALMRSR